MSDRTKNGPTPRREDQRAACLAGRRAAEAGQPQEEQPPQEITCSGGLSLKRPGAGNG